MKNIIEFKKILIAVDASEYSQKAAEYGMQLSRKLGAEVALIHIDEFPMVANMVGDPMLGDQMMVLPELADIQNDTSKHLLAQLKSDFGDGLTITEIIKTGDIKHEILTAADTWMADVIVMGTHGRTGFDHFILGSMAESITRQANCPVFIVPNSKNEE